MKIKYLGYVINQYGVTCFRNKGAVTQRRMIYPQKDEWLKTSESIIDKLDLLDKSLWQNWGKYCPSLRKSINDFRILNY